MTFWSSERGQSIQIGAVLIFATLIIAFSMYQAFMVPQQNEGIEYRHARDVIDDMKQLRSAILNVGGTSTTQSQTIELGTEYPSRMLAVNPPPPSGALRTAARGQIKFNRSFSIAGVCGYTGTARSLVYDPNFNEYRNAPLVGYDNSVVYRNYSGRIIVDSNQTMIQGETIQITPLNATYSVSGTKRVTLTFKGGPSNGTVETVTEPLNMTIPTKIPASEWENNNKLFGDTDVVQSVDQADSSYASNAINVTLEANTYTLACRAVGINSFPSSGAAKPPGIDAGGYGEGSSETYDPNNPTAERLRTAGGTLVGIVNASHIVMENPSFSLVKASDGQIGGTNKRYLQLGLKLTNASIGRDEYRRYFFIISEKKGLTYKLDTDGDNNISWGKKKVSLYRDQTGGEATKLFDDKALAESVLDSWVIDGDRLELLLEENYQSSNAVDSELKEVRKFLNNSEKTKLVVTNLHGKVTLNVTNKVDRTLGGGSSQINVVTYIQKNQGTIQTISADTNEVQIYEPTSNSPQGIGRKSADLDVSGTGTDIPFKGGNNGYLRAVADDNSTETLVATSNSIKSKPMGVGDWDDDGNQEVLYVGNNNELKQYEPATGTASKLTYSNDTTVGKLQDVKAVAGVGDFAGDSSAEVVFIQKKKVKYMSANNTDSSRAGSGNEKVDKNKGVSTLADFDDDGTQEIATYENSGSGIRLWDSNGPDGSHDPSGYQVKGAPMAAADWAGDSTPEIIFLQSNNNKVRYFNWDDKSSSIITNSTGSEIKAKGNYGVR